MIEKETPSKKTAAKKAPAKSADAETASTEATPKEAPVVKCVVKSLKTPLAVPGAVLARGGKATIPLKTAEYLAANGDLVILEIL